VGRKKRRMRIWRNEKKGRRKPQPEELLHLGWSMR
jgi:hypothetical protein